MHFYAHPESDSIWHQEKPTDQWDILELTRQEYAALYLEAHGVLPEAVILPYQYRTSTVLAVILCTAEEGVLGTVSGAFGALQMESLQSAWIQ